MTIIFHSFKHCIRQKTHYFGGESPSIFLCTTGSHRLGNQPLYLYIRKNQKSGNLSVYLLFHASPISFFLSIHASPEGCDCCAQFCVYIPLISFHASPEGCDSKIMCLQIFLLQYIKSSYHFSQLQVLYDAKTHYFWGCESPHFFYAPRVRTS